MTGRLLSGHSQIPHLPIDYVSVVILIHAKEKELTAMSNVFGLALRTIVTVVLGGFCGLIFCPQSFAQKARRDMHSMRHTNISTVGRDG